MGADLLARCGAVVVAHNRVDFARACVASLRRDLAAGRIVVVVNDPRGVPAADVAELARDVIVLSPLRPAGYGANLNLGVIALGSDVDACVLSNDDVVFEPGSLARLVDLLRQDPRLAVAGGNVVNADGSEQVSHWRFPSARGEVRRVAVPWRPLWASKGRGEDDRDSLDGGPVREVDCVTGAALVVRVDAFRAAGGFDEDFFLYYEETDLCFRLRRAGWSIAWCEDARIVHELGVSLRRAGEGGFARASRRLYFRKRLGGVRFRAFQAALAVTFAGSATTSVARALVRPRAGAARVAAVRERWHERLFL